jgi:putative FmdB family regulatory protein
MGVKLATYTYNCKGCNAAEIEIKKGMNDPNPLCPECKEDTLVMQLERPVFVRKGRGWDPKTGS